MRKEKRYEIILMKVTKEPTVPGMNLKPYYPIAATVQRLIQHTAASVITLLRVQDYTVMIDAAA